MFVNPKLGALQFGFELGTGFRTYLPGTAPYLLLAWSLICGLSWAYFAISGIGFGFGRWLLLVERSWYQNPSIWDQQLMRFKSRLAIVSSAILGGGLIVVSITPLVRS